jgi:hypothetical protein
MCRSSHSPPKKYPEPQRARDAVFHPRAVVVKPTPDLEGVFTSPGSGLLTPGSSYLLGLPMIRRSQWFFRLSSPVTAAGPRRIRTVFPAPKTH